MKIGKIAGFVASIVSAIALSTGILVGASADDAARPEAGRYYVQTFENFKDMYNCGFENFYGKVDLSSEFASEGKTSAKIQVKRLANTTAPRFHIDARSASYGYDYSDFGMVDYVGFSLKNGNDFDTTVNFYVAGNNGGKIMNEYCSLPAGGSGDFKFKVNRVAATVDNEPAASFEFVPEWSEGIWYLDGLYVETAYSAVQMVEKDFDGKDILSFDDISDINHIAVDQVTISSIFVVSANVSSTPDRKSVLKVSFDRRMSVSADDEIHPRAKYSGFKMSKSFMENFDFGRFKTERLSVDVMNVSDRPHPFVIRFEDAYGAAVDKITVIRPNEWTTVTFSFDDIDGSGLMADKARKLAFYADLQNFGGSGAFLFDNIKMEENA